MCNLTVKFWLKTKSLQRIGNFQNVLTLNNKERHFTAIFSPYLFPSKTRLTDLLDFLNPDTTWTDPNYCLSQRAALTGGILLEMSIKRSSKHHLAVPDTHFVSPLTEQ